MSAGSTGQVIVTVIRTIPVLGHSERDLTSCTKIGQATMPNRQRRDDAMLRQLVASMPVESVSNAAETSRVG